MLSGGARRRRRRRRRRCLAREGLSALTPTEGAFVLLMDRPWSASATPLADGQPPEPAALEDV